MRRLGALLGIDLLSGDKHTIAGVTGVEESFYIHPVTLKVGGWPHEIRAGFLQNIADLGYGVVGQRGFFDLYIVTFNFAKEEIELKERKK